MEKEGIVLLWLGNMESEDFLEDYFRIKYTDDGDSIPSLFIKDFHICMYDIDEDFIILTEKTPSSKRSEGGG
ncbi:immunity 22 family protein [Bacillus bingmayongensis]|uniref:immunity 22 family protein n=1 Tax=Bacillus bingmayongensis TaxID=1150157 RepID=UPI0002D6BDC3|nr:immunity 22 family protein [Bacillus bingmayongensis]